jgi:hypothetical protein
MKNIHTSDAITSIIAIKTPAAAAGLLKNLTSLPLSTLARGHMFLNTHPTGGFETGSYIPGRGGRSRPSLSTLVLPLLWAVGMGTLVS